MKFAVISDIHGNLTALNAIIKDAEKENVDQFIFVGDYCIGNPFPDECVSRIRSLEKKYLIQGNEEKYLEYLIGEDQRTWTDGQMQISYWVYQQVAYDNLQYLLSLPTMLQLRFEDIH